MSEIAPVFIGIDTSNYTTSLAVADIDGRVIANIKRLLPVAAGERGLRQSDAVFAHVKNLPELLTRLGEAVDGKNVVAVGCSTSPRDAEDSYMPCFLVGRDVGYGMAAVSSAPIYEFSHQSGHIMAALYSANAVSLLEGERFAAFHVSGGTTEILLVDPKKDSFEVTLAGGTADLNFGQAIDRAGVMMGLSFPCGAEMERIALLQKEKPVKFKISVKGLECNVSGLENQANELYKNTKNKALVCSSVFDFVGRNLIKLTENLTEKFGDISIVYSGGVMSNSIIKDMLSARKNTFFAQPEFSSDNACGTALLCRMKHLSMVDGENNGSV